jgi:isocitrate dehydrogenase kinase/phosphatase
MFPQRLDSTVAYDIATAMIDGFNRNYRLFRSESARAKHRFETADWQSHQARIRAGHVSDVFPYERSKRFHH